MLSLIASIPCFFLGAHHLFVRAWLHTEGSPAAAGPTGEERGGEKAELVRTGHDMRIYLCSLCKSKNHTREKCELRQMFDETESVE